MTALPAPVARYRELALRDGPRSVETIELDTDGWMREPGLPQIPLRIRIAHKLGREFVHDIRIGRGPLSFRIGLDAYVGGHGLMKVGRSLQAGPHFDQGAFIAMWSVAVDFPSAWEGRDDVRWEPVDDRTARLVVSGPEGETPITIGFDPASCCPVYCEAERYKGPGPKVRWRGISTGWHRWPDGVLAPGRMAAHWSDEPRPWLVLRTRSVRVNVPVDEAFRLGDRALRALPAFSPR